MGNRGIAGAGAGVALAGILATGAAVAMGSLSSSPPPMPSACEVLQAIDTSALLGDKPDFTLNNDNTGDMGRMSTCIALEGTSKNQLVLLLRAASTAPKQDAATLRKDYIDSVNAVADPKMTTRNLDIGDAAVWTKDDSQLAFWTHKGQLMMVLSGGNTLPGGAASFPLSKLEDVAREIVAAYP